MSNTQTTKNIKTGDNVYLARMGSWDLHYTPGQVTKITPSGLIDVQTSGSTRRFNADGKMVGGGYQDGTRIDLYMTFEERKALLAKTDSLIAQLDSLIAQLDSLIAQLDLLQIMIDNARKLTEVI